MSTAATSTFATTPPAADSAGLSTSNEAVLLTSLAGTNIAASATWSAPYSSYSRSNDPTTVTVDSSGNSSSSSSDETILDRWNGLSNTTKYAIYGAAGVVALLIIGLIVLCCRRSRRKKAQAAANSKNMARMTQRSSFGHTAPMAPQGHDSYMYANAAGDESFSSAHFPSAGMTRAETQDSMDKNRYASDDVYSVHSVPPMYGNNAYAQQDHDQRSQYSRQGGRGDETSYPPTSPPYSGNQGQRGPGSDGRGTPYSEQYAHQSNNGYGQAPSRYAAFAGGQEEDDGYSQASYAGQHQQQGYQNAYHHDERQRGESHQDYGY